MSKQLIFHEAMGSEIRRGNYIAHGVSSYTLVEEALKNKQFEDAAVLTQYTICEAQEAYDLFTQWMKDIPSYMFDRGVSDLEIKNSAKRIDNLLRDKTGQKFDGYTGWQRYKDLIANTVEACFNEDSRNAAIFLEEARQVWRDTHDRLCDGVYGWIDAAARSLGEDEIGVLWDYLMSPMYGTYDNYDVAVTPWPRSLDKLMHVALEGLRGHLSGLDRRGDLEIEEQAERWAIRFNPCGSGGRTMRDDRDSGTGPRMEPPYNFGVTTKPHDWSWGKTGVCLYCVHCCVLNEQMPTRRFGYPTRVVEPPIWPEAKSGSKCTWYIYKDPSLISDEIYHRIGKIKPNKIFGEA